MIDSNFPLKKQKPIVIRSSEGFFSGYAIKYNSTYISGIISPINSSSVSSYSYYRKAGADTVLKKLGRQPIVGAASVYSVYADYNIYPGTFLVTQGFKYITITNDISKSSSSAYDSLYLYGTFENEDNISSSNAEIGTNLGQITRASTVTFDISNYTAVRIVNTRNGGYAMMCHFKLHD